MRLAELEKRARKEVEAEAEAQTRHQVIVKSARARGRQRGFETATCFIADRNNVNVTHLREHCTIDSQHSEWRPFTQDGVPVRVPQALVISIKVPDHEPIICNVKLTLTEPPELVETQVAVDKVVPLEYLVNCVESVMRTCDLGRALVQARDDYTKRLEAS